MQRDGWQRFTIPRRQPLPLAGRDPRRRRRVVGVVLHRRSARSPPSRRAAAHRGRRQRFDPGRHPLRRRRAGDGRAACTPGAGWLEVRRGALAADGDRPRLQPHPRCGDDAGRDGAVRRRPDAAAQHRQLARQGDRPARRDGRPSCASSAPRSIEGADFIAIDAAGALARARAIAAPTTTTAWRCACRWRRSTRRPAATCRCASSTRAASPRPSRTTSRRCSRSRQTDAARHPGDHASTARPRRARARWRAPSPRSSAITCSTRARCTGPRRWRRMQAGVERRRRARRSARWRRRSTCASTAGRICSAARDVTDALRPEDVGALRLAGLGAARGARRAARRCRLAFRRVPGPGGRRARHGHASSSPTPTLKVFLTASAAERAERRHKQLISKGISAKIDSLRADLEARDARDMQSQRVAPEAGRRRAPAGQLGAHRSKQSVDRVLEVVGGAHGLSTERRRDV